MAYKITVICSICDKEEEVPALNAIPGGWNQLGYFDESDPNKPIIKHFCCWEHLISFARSEKKKVKNEPKQVSKTT